MRTNEYALHSPAINAAPQYEPHQAGGAMPDSFGYHMNGFAFMPNVVSGYEKAYPAYGQAAVQTVDDRSSSLSAYAPSVSANHHASSNHVHTTSGATPYNVSPQVSQYSNAQHFDLQPLPSGIQGYHYKGQQKQPHEPEHDHHPTASPFGMQEHDWGDVPQWSNNANWGGATQPASARLYGKDPSLHLKLQSLTQLDNLVGAYKAVLGHYQ